MKNQKYFLKKLRQSVIISGKKTSSSILKTCGIERNLYETRMGTLEIAYREGNGVMVILHVTGNKDYGVITFEKNYPNIQKAYKKALDNDDYFETDAFRVEIKRFHDVDPIFINFLKEYILDYDSLKDENFYIVEP